MNDFITIAVNGRMLRVQGAEAFLPLSDFLRLKRGLTGTKVVCAEGDCGACTVLLGRLRGGRFTYLPVNSCILLTLQVHGAHVVTVEGLTRDGLLSAVQHAMIENFGSQCGYCTPGFVVTMTGLLERKRERGENLTEEELRVGLSGNLCRCTGYVQIIEAGAAIDPATTPSMEDIYPETELKETLSAAAKEPVRLQTDGRNGDGHCAFLPSTLEEALQEKARVPDARVLSGASDLGVLYNKGKTTLPSVLSLTSLSCLKEVSIRDGALVADACVTWTQVCDTVRDVVPEFYKILLRFGSPQIRNVGTVGGNIGNASPISDSAPFYFVTGSTFELTSEKGTRTVLAEKFYKSYKVTELRPEELITRVVTPLPKKGEILKLYKVSRRKDLDISTFDAALLAQVEGNTVKSIRIAFGGVAVTVVRMRKTEEFLVGRAFTRETFAEAGDVACGEIRPISDVRGSSEYRLQLAQGILLKFYHDVAGSGTLSAAAEGAVL